MLSAPLMEPYLEPVTVEGSDYVLGGLLHQGPGTNSLAPPVLFHEVTRRTNLVAYDWELTGPRLDAWLYIGQLFRLFPSGTGCRTKAPASNGSKQRHPSWATAPPQSRARLRTSFRLCGGPPLALPRSSCTCWPIGSNRRSSRATSTPAPLTAWCRQPASGRGPTRFFRRALSGERATWSWRPLRDEPAFGNLPLLLDMAAEFVRLTPASPTEPSERRRTALVCALLALGALAIYAPVYYYDFLNYDDGDYVIENPQVNAGLMPRGLIWAFGQSARRTHLLAPADLGLAHVGLPVVRVAPRPASPGQCDVSYRQQCFSVSGVEADDTGLRAERHGGRPVRLAPVAGGYRRLDCRAKEFAQHAVLAADDVGVQPLRGSPKSEARSPKPADQSLQSRGRSPAPRATHHATAGTDHDSRFTFHGSISFPSSSSPWA